MTKSELISINDEYLFRETLSRAKLIPDQKAMIIRERQMHLVRNCITKCTNSIPIGPYTDPLTGLRRFNTGR